MDYRRRTPACLHREHVETLGLLDRLDAALAARRPPATGDRDWARLAAAFRAHLGGEIGRHFDFEERDLFAVLAEGGENDIAAVLADEHAAIRARAAEVVRLLAEPAALADPAAWAAFRPAALDLVERLVAHVQKEEMSLLPALEDTLDEARDADLADRYLAPA